VQTRGARTPAALMALPGWAIAVIVVAVLFLLVVIVLKNTVYIVHQGEGIVIERFGRFNRVLSAWRPTRKGAPTRSGSVLCAAARASQPSGARAGARLRARLAHSRGARSRRRPHARAPAAPSAAPGWNFVTPIIEAPRNFNWRRTCVARPVACARRAQAPGCGAAAPPARLPLASALAPRRARCLSPRPRCPCPRGPGSWT
jgi:hypothetical protein